MSKWGVKHGSLTSSLRLICESSGYPRRDDVRVTWRHAAAGLCLYVQCPPHVNELNGSRDCQALTDRQRSLVTCQRDKKQDKYQGWY